MLVLVGPFWLKVLLKLPACKRVLQIFTGEAGFKVKTNPIIKYCLTLILIAGTSHRTVGISNGGSTTKAIGDTEDYLTSEFGGGRKLIVFQERNALFEVIYSSP